MPEFTGVIQYADELTRIDLQGLRDWYFAWLLITTGIVVFGLALEGPEVVHDTLNLVRGPSRKKEASPWIKWLASMGWILIILGVLGEFVSEALVSKADGLVQTFNNILLVDAQRKAGDAKTSADKAADAAERSSKAFSKLSVRAEQLEKEEQKTSEAQRRAAEAQLELKKFSEQTFMRTRPRVIQMDRKAFVEKLRGIPPVRVAVLYKPDDDEAYMLGSAIVSLLSLDKDGLKWPDVSGPTPISEATVLSWPSRKLDKNRPLSNRAGGWNGVGLVTKYEPEYPPPNPFETPTRATGAWAILYALQAGKISASSIATDPEMPADIVRIVIGSMLD